MDTYHSFIVNHEKLMNLIAYGSKDFKELKIQDI